MVGRDSWLALLQDAWRRRSVIWLTGVRRSGKTVLVQSVPGVEYFDCELPRVRRLLADPEEFLSRFKDQVIALDEVHRLENPSEILKIGADHFPKLRIIATGSATLAASARFRDTLTGRKAEVWLTPMNQADLVAFGRTDLRHRLAHGGLPPFFLADQFPEREFAEWVDAYWARDIQELFRLERRVAFLRLFELLVVQSGGMFEAASFAGPCEISRATVSTYVAVLEATRVVHVIRPHSGRRAHEIIAAPKIYAFDTGFVCHYRGWDRLRDDDLGLLWEHVVLDELHSQLQAPVVKYWRDKRGHEVDFVVTRRGHPPVAVECKWKASGFDPKNLLAFRRLHPGTQNWVVSQDVDRPFHRKLEGLEIEFLGLEHLGSRLG